MAIVHTTTVSTKNLQNTKVHICNVDLQDDDDLITRWVIFCQRGDQSGKYDCSDYAGDNNVGENINWYGYGKEQDLSAKRVHHSEA